MFYRPDQGSAGGEGSDDEPGRGAGASRMVFPVTLESGQYIEYEGPADCRLHDERGAVLKRITPQGEVPSIAPGKTTSASPAMGPLSIAFVPTSL